ncbi:ABC transporter permease [Paenibacillus sp. GSMTC-2017]|uniref:ABC transporter permease n=1 Tax=Paenibacillus sp. GSMTC-2017 TaxID=2794350 RepID=UPI0018D986E3|nr:ABC transporter permease [Paenibacillus sp. GSMTC-2017]
MLRFILGKVVSMAISLFLLVTATFLLMNSVPGSPFQGEKALSPAVQANLEAYYGLDKPMIVQYGNYLKNLLQGDMGVSMKKKFQSVDKMIKESFGPSLKLGLTAIVTSVIVGCLIGILAAMNHRKMIDNVVMSIAVIGLAIPSIVMAPVLQYILATKLGWFGVAGLDDPLDYVLPTIALSAAPIAFIARLLRSTMIEVLSADFIKTAKSKGLSGYVIVAKHALRNSLLPVVTYLGYLTAGIITGSVVVEKIFSIPGIGKHFVSSVIDRDYPLIMGITIFYAIILMVSRLLADIAYVLVDPRMRAGGKVGK